MLEKMRFRHTALVAGLSTVLVLGVTGAVYAASGFGSSGAAPTVGTIPESAFGGGPLDPSKVPDFIQTLDRSGNPVGYVKKLDVIVIPGTTSTQRHTNNPTPVYAADLKTVIGHMYPGVGFVGNGQPVPHVAPPSTVIAPPPSVTPGS